MVAFVAVENPAGIFGLKQRDVISDPNPVKEKFPNKWGEADIPADSRHKLDLYKGREKSLAGLKPEWAPQGISRDLIDDANENLATLSKIYGLVKSNADIRVLMCSSVNSMTKYIQKYCASNLGTTIDTLVIFGHGAADSMNVGLGRIGGLSPKNLPELKGPDLDKRLRLRKETGVEKGSLRYIEAEDDRWLGAFHALRPHVGTDPETAAFHLYFMACDIGEDTEGKTPDKLLIKMAAEHLPAALGLDPGEVVVAAPAHTIKEDALTDLVKKLRAINQLVIRPHGGARVGKVNLVSSSDW